MDPLLDTFIQWWRYGRWCLLGGSRSLGKIDLVFTSSLFFILPKQTTMRWAALTYTPISHAILSYCTFRNNGASWPCLKPLKPQTKCSLSYFKLFLSGICLWWEARLAHTVSWTLAHHELPVSIPYSRAHNQQNMHTTKAGTMWRVGTWGVDSEGLCLIS